MATQLFSITFGANDVVALVRFWAEGLGWQVVVADRKQTVVAPTSPHQVAMPDSIGTRNDGAPTVIERSGATKQSGRAAGLTTAPTQGPGVPLKFVRVPEPKAEKNRIHLDLASTSDEAQSQTVDRLLRLGANHVNIGQRHVLWVVLADPEGNEFCVLPPNLIYAETGSVAAIVLDAADPTTLGRFWSEAKGWPVVRETNRVAVLRRRNGSGPFLTLGPPVAQGKNRVHFDLAVYSADEQQGAVKRLVSLGAKLVDLGHGHIGGVALADPEGNEFCVLSSPRGLCLKSLQT